MCLAPFVGPFCVPFVFVGNEPRRPDLVGEQVIESHDFDVEFILSYAYWSAKLSLMLVTTQRGTRLRTLLKVM